MMQLRSQAHIGLKSEMAAIMLIAMIVLASAQTFGLMKVALGDEPEDDEDGDGREEEHDHTSTSEESPEDAAEALDEAMKEIEEVRERIDRASARGANTSQATDVLSDAEELVSRARRALEEGNYEEALALAEQAKKIAGNAKEIAESAEERQEEIREAREELSEAAEEVRKARSLLPNASNAGIDVEIFERILNETSLMLERAEAMLTQSPEEAEVLAKRASELAERVRKALEDAVRESEETSAQAMSSLSASVSGNVTLEEEEMEIEHELSVDRGVIVQKLEKKTFKRLDNGTMVEEIVEEKVLAVGNQTIVEIRREVRVNGAPVMQSREVRSLNRTVMGSFLLIGERSEIREVDNRVSVEVKNRGEGYLKLVVSAPDGTEGKMVALHLDASAIGLMDNGSIVVLVNGKEVPIASGIVELLSGVYSEPAYLLVKSSSGAQILLYFPHFSEYLVEVKAVAERIVGGIVEPLISSQTLMAATLMAATALLLIAAVKARSKRIKAL